MAGFTTANRLASGTIAVTSVTSGTSCAALLYHIGSYRGRHGADEPLRRREHDPRRTLSQEPTRRHPVGARRR